MNHGRILRQNCGEISWFQELVIFSSKMFGNWFRLCRNFCRNLKPKPVTAQKTLIVFLSGSPLSNEITHQRGNEWDPCCTLYFFICCALYFYHVLNGCTLYIIFYHVNKFVKSKVGNLVAK